MPATLTAQSFRLDDLYRADADTLTDWDSHGYTVIYYPANAYTTRDDADVVTFDTLPNGEVMIRDHSEDALCGGCAAKWLRDEDDGVVTAAFTINGEAGDCRDEYCDDCGALLYEAPADLCGDNLERDPRHPDYTPEES